MRCSKCIGYSIKEWLHNPVKSPAEIVDTGFQRTSDGLIFHSNYIMKKYTHKHDYPGLAYVVPLPGYRTKTNMGGEESKRPNPNLDSNGMKNLVVPGYVSPFKGVDVIIEAVSEIEHDFMLIFLGGIDDRRYDEYLKRLIRKHHLERKVKFTGFVDDKYFVKELDNACIVLVPRFISPWYKKTLPFKLRKIIDLKYQVEMTTSAVLTEALAAGKPIVCSKTPGFSEYINPKRGILCEDTRQSWESAIRKLLNNPDMVRKMGSQSREFAQNEINPDKIAKKHVEIYKEVLEND
jgi:glycosyltransferase involved in cell wall biosynthesis